MLFITLAYLDLPELGEKSQGRSAQASPQISRFYFHEMCIYFQNPPWSTGLLIVSCKVLNCGLHILNLLISLSVYYKTFLFLTLVPL